MNGNSMEADTHIFITRSMIEELFYINEAITNGDIVSPKAALPRVEKLVGRYRSFYGKVGCMNISLMPYIASGGFIGISFSFSLSKWGEPIKGNIVPRRHDS